MTVRKRSDIFILESVFHQLCLLGECEKLSIEAYNERGLKLNLRLDVSRRYLSLFPLRFLFSLMEVREEDQRSGIGGAQVGVCMIAAENSWQNSSDPICGAEHAESQRKLR